MLVLAPQAAFTSDLYPDQVIEQLKEAGFQIATSYSAYAGQLISGDQSVTFSMETDKGRAIGMFLTSNYNFPTRISSRGLQDWSGQLPGDVKAQSYLDGSVSVSDHVSLPLVCTPKELATKIQTALTPFSMFNDYYVRPLGGQQVKDRSTLFAPKPSAKMVVDYLSRTDLTYLAKVWGWNYDAPVVEAISSTWSVPISIDGRLWKVTGISTLPEPGSSPISGFMVVGQFQAASKKSQQLAKQWHRRFKSDQVWISPNSGDVTLQTRINLGEGIPLSAVRQRILDFVHRAEKLPAADTGVFG